MSRFNHIFKEDGLKLTKHEKAAMFQELCYKGPKIIIDCEFDDLMYENEKKSMGQQLAYCHNINKKQEIPCNLIVTGMTPGSLISNVIEKQGSKSWAVTFSEKSYMDLLKPTNLQDLVYLTADSENVITSLDNQKTYIIGGIVDRNRYPTLTYDKAIK